MKHIFSTLASFILSVCIYAQNAEKIFIYFDHDSDLLTKTEQSKLSDALAIPNITKIIIEGHTDNVGDPVYNRQLSQRRTNTVYNYLLTVGIAPDMINDSFFGEDIPVTENFTEQDKQLNRRVEVTIFYDVPPQKPQPIPTKTEEIITKKTLPKPDIPDSIAIDNSLLNSKLAQQLEAEIFTIDNTRDTMIKTLSGILFYFNKHIFEGDCSHEITIKVTDYSRSSRAILANAPTLSDDRLLYSAGMFEIRAFCGDLSVDVKENEDYNIFFPLRGDISAARKFKGFYGQRDSLTDAVNWQQASTNALRTINGNSMCRGCVNLDDYYEKCFWDRFFMTKKRRYKITQAERRYYRLLGAQRRYPNIDFDAIRSVPDCGASYFEFRGQRMGFINLDVFWDMRPEVRTNVLVRLDAEDNTQVWMVFESRRSIMRPTKTLRKGYKFSRIPKNEDVWIVAIKIDAEGKPFVGFTKANTSDEQINLELEEVESLVTLAKALERIDRG